MVLADCTVRGATPSGWARAAISAMEQYGADRLVAEVNQGGDMIETILRTHAPAIPYKAVRAMTGKIARAEPIAALYEQGRVVHARGLQQLEQQMTSKSSLVTKYLRVTMYTNHL